MTPPRRGLSFDDALERYSPPDAYAAMKRLAPFASSVSIFIAGAHSDPREEEYQRLRRLLEAALFERLASGELLSSATEEKPDPTHPRFVVHRSLYDGTEAFYVEFSQVVRANNRELWNVEIFEPRAIPLNVDTVPPWVERLVGATAPPPLSPEPARSPAPAVVQFRHDEGYRHVWLAGQEYLLTPKQADIVRVLHEAALAGRPWMRLEDIRDAADFGSAKLSQNFRRMTGWRSLIRSDRRGYYRLNLEIPEG